MSNTPDKTAKKNVGDIQPESPVPPRETDDPPPMLAPAPTVGPTTPSIPTKQPSDAPLGEPGKNEEERLDEALQETMTTSDPVSIKIA